MFEPLRIKVWGPWACFTRPEAKVERMSYEIMTPSAARGVMEAIYWHPPVSWHIREIWVMNPIRLVPWATNEVLGRVNMPIAQRRIAGDVDARHSIMEHRTQRHNLILRDVSYVIVADLVNKPGVDGEGVVKHREQFQRRVEKGECFHRPFLGCREFAAHFGPVDGTEHPINVVMDLGRMLFDLDYTDVGRGQPRFFPAELDRGIMRVPAHLYMPQKLQPSLGGMGIENAH